MNSRFLQRHWCSSLTLTSKYLHSNAPVHFGRRSARRSPRSGNSGSCKRLLGQNIRLRSPRLQCADACGVGSRESERRVRRFATMYHQMSNAPNLTYAEALEYLRVGRRAFDMHLRPLLPRPPIPEVALIGSRCRRARGSTVESRCRARVQSEDPRPTRIWIPAR